MRARKRSVNLNIRESRPLIVDGDRDLKEVVAAEWYDEENPALVEGRLTGTITQRHRIVIIIPHLSAFLTGRGFIPGVKVEMRLEGFPSELRMTQAQVTSRSNADEPTALTGTSAPSRTRTSRNERTAGSALLAGKAGERVQPLSSEGPLRFPPPTDHTIGETVPRTHPRRAPGRP